MAALAIAFDGQKIMAAKDTQEILGAIRALDDKASSQLGTLSGIVAGLVVKVDSVQAQIIVLSTEMKDKATKPELRDLEVRIEKELNRATDAVGKDVSGFENMYDSVVGEVGELRDQVSKVLAGQSSASETIKAMDERLKKLEPLRDTWLQVIGNKWIISFFSGGIGAGMLAGVLKFFGILK